MRRRVGRGLGNELARFGWERRGLGRGLARRGAGGTRGGVLFDAAEANCPEVSVQAVERADFL